MKQKGAGFAAQLAPQRNEPAREARATATEGPVLEQSLLRDCFGDDDAGFLENLEIFMTAMHADLEILADAMDRRSAVEIKHTAHRIKGAARFIGGVQLAAASEALEVSAAKRSWPEIDSRWLVLLSASRDVATEICRRRA